MTLPADSPMNDVITDRSDNQKQIRLQEMSKELDTMGYQIVSKEWLREFAMRNFDILMSK